MCVYIDIERKKEYVTQGVDAWTLIYIYYGHAIDWTHKQGQPGEDYTAVYKLGDPPSDSRTKTFITSMC